jgi:hypothetical protein
MAQSKVNISQLYAAGATAGQVPTAGASGPLTYQEIPALVKWVTQINLKTVAQTSLFTVPLGKRFIPLRLAVIVDSITGGAAMPSVQFGTSGTPTLFLSAEALDATMNDAGRTFVWQLVGNAANSADVLQFGVTVGGTSTTHLATALIEGWLIDAAPTP